MAPTGFSNAPSSCSTGNCQQQAPAPAPAPAPVSANTGKPMHPALINRPHNECGCPVEDDACACNKPKFVAPEIKPEPCACEQEENCACRSSHLVAVSDECGCLHLEVCPCRRSSVEPETRENHVAPEIRETPLVHNCGCPQEDTACGCNKPQFVAPEIKPEPCACQEQVEVDCPCSHFRRNF